jgi:hypothetical protein
MYCHKKLRCNAWLSPNREDDCVSAIIIVQCVDYSMYYLNLFCIYTYPKLFMAQEGVATGG